MSHELRTHVFCCVKCMKLLPRQGFAISRIFYFPGNGKSKKIPEIPGKFRQIFLPGKIPGKIREFPSREIPGTNPTYSIPNHA